MLRILFTYHVYRAPHQYQFPYTMVNNHKRRLFFQPTILQLQQTIPHNDRSNISNRRHDNAVRLAYLALNDSYNCIHASAYLCDIEPNKHYNYSSCAHPEYSHRYSGNFVVQRSHHESMDHFQCSSLRLCDCKFEWNGKLIIFIAGAHMWYLFETFKWNIVSWKC